MEESEVAEALIAYTRLADVVGEAEHDEIVGPFVFIFSNQQGMERFLIEIVDHRDDSLCVVRDEDDVEIDLVRRRVLEVCTEENEKVAEANLAVENRGRKRKDWARSNL
ncbi:hypothetical protein SKAU_G00048150 [Synaphobranchus kaupii]|uniref:Uncharacterized protein n=1 Tax=Synaphobranchus kaupii TaxID=118154 RepID=A0A9Q1J9H5_SYNKA|nr:hypothetical protein SKAU_G00048150 [Synaphobranchus kaupii]